MKQIGTKVQYFGIDIVIQYPYVATDIDGLVCNYEHEPSVETSSFNSGYGYFIVAKVDLEGMDWKDTLVKFELRN